MADKASRRRCAAMERVFPIYLAQNPAMENLLKPRAPRIMILFGMAAAVLELRHNDFERVNPGLEGTGVALGLEVSF